MANSIFNTFLIIFGFCLLGLPIILISVTTAPAGIDEFNSSIIINTIDGDSQSALVMDNTALINGSSLDYWDQITGLPQLSHLNNITQLMIDEAKFMENVSLSDYEGLSKEVHVFELEMTISTTPLSAAGAKDSYANLFGTSNGSFFSWMWGFDEWNSSHVSQPTYPYPSINDTIETIYSSWTIEYEISVNFYANIEVDGVQKTTQFSRLIYFSDFGEVVFFITDEIEWSVV